MDFLDDLMNYIKDNPRAVSILFARDLVRGDPKQQPIIHNKVKEILDDLKKKGVVVFDVGKVRDSVEIYDNIKLTEIGEDYFVNPSRAKSMFFSKRTVSLGKEASVIVRKL